MELEISRKYALHDFLCKILNKKFSYYNFTPGSVARINGVIKVYDGTNWIIIK